MPFSFRYIWPLSYYQVNWRYTVGSCLLLLCPRLGTLKPLLSGHPWNLVFSSCLCHNTWPLISTHPIKLCLYLGIISCFPLLRPMCMLMPRLPLELCRLSTNKVLPWSTDMLKHPMLFVVLQHSFGFVHTGLFLEYPSQKTEWLGKPPWKFLHTVEVSRGLNL